MTADAEPSPSADKARVFISYSRKDMAFADRLDAALKTRGFEPLIDRSEIYAFEDWWKRLQALIQRADTVVFVLSPDAVASREALREVEYAASLNKRFAPIVCRRVEEAAIPEALRRLNFVFFDDAAEFEASTDRLDEALRTDIGWIRKHTEYGEAARQWAAAGRPGGLQLRSPALEDAERWIASRPANAPAPTEDMQAFIAESRRGATRRRNILTGSLAAGLVMAVVLAGLAYWQREVAVEQRQIADQQRQRAEDTLAAATKTANGLVFDLAQRFRDTIGIPASLVKDILDRARGLQDQLLNSGETSPDLRKSQASALGQASLTLLALGETKSALAAAKQQQEILQTLATSQPTSTDLQFELSAADINVGDVHMAQSDLADALTAFRASLAIRDRLAKSDPGNAGRQFALGVAYERIGDVLKAQGNLSGALKSYSTRRDLVSRVAASAPDNASWQRDLAIAYTKVGNVEVEEGHLPNGLTSFQASLQIFEQLARSDPASADRQRDLSTAHDLIGKVQFRQGDLPAALASYQAKSRHHRALGEVRRK